jgi:isochorismate pyruvate lyase
MKPDAITTSPDVWDQLRAAHLGDRATKVKFARGARVGNRRRMQASPEPEDCQTMTEVRAGIDAIDRQIVELIARRFRFMDAAARIKPDRDAVRDEDRKAEVLAKVDKAAAEAGVDRSLMARIYEELIEGSIAYEFVEFDRLRAG